ncbi:MAG: hypothetical protein V7722_04740 [Porticoccus sp.]
MKRIIAKNRAVVASLLVGWLLLCGMMPLMAVDMDMEMAMNMGMEDMSIAHSHIAHSHHGAPDTDGLTEESNTTGIDQHCCDVLDDSVLVIHNQFIDLLFDLSLIAAVCSFFFLWGMATGRINTYYYSFIPPPGPPIHKRLCVWLD